MSDTVEAIQGAAALVFSGFILLVFARALSQTTLDTSFIDIGLIGIFALLGGVVVFITAVAVLLGKLFT
jgi:hypothetical protein